MKNRLLFTLLTLLLWLCCHAADPLVLEPGVSLPLARHRSHTIQQVDYDLFFSLPAEREAAITGTATLRFTLTEAEPIVLDFREDASHLHGLCVNGVAETICWEMEHIVVPATHLVCGENVVTIHFTAGDQSLNRSGDYLYTLLVPERARTVFPCFDQPDMKATFALQLELPAHWEAVANGALVETVYDVPLQRKRITFARTLPIPTYLFGFVAGEWECATECRDGVTIHLYHRENNAQKLAQLDEVFNQVYASLAWMAEYTGVQNPFPKYDMVVVPGFQFGGMEQPGVILYNAQRIFLPENATVDQLMNRRKLLAHETAHLWFGDAVTMEWFNDVWTKEVFANYFAAEITTSGSEDAMSALHELRNFYIPAYTENRTLGATAIKQELDNLQNAGLIYGNMVYYKAPIVMRMLVDKIGKVAFRAGMREYVERYLYGNSTWEDLVAILDSHTRADLTSWSRTWVSEKAMPTISAVWEAGKMVVKQHDPSGNHLVWEQPMDVLLIDGDRMELIENVALNSAQTVWDLSHLDMESPHMVLNISGRAYGFFSYDDATIQYLLTHMAALPLTPQQRLACWINLYENFVNGKVDGDALANLLLATLHTEQEPLIISALTLFLRGVTNTPRLTQPQVVEQGVWELARTAPDGRVKQAAFGVLVEIARSPAVVEELYKIWKERQAYEGVVLSEQDYIRLSYLLCLHRPEQYQAITQEQLARLAHHNDKRLEYVFVMRALHPSKAERDAFFEQLLLAENRRKEPWVTQALSYLNHPLRQPEALDYLRRTLVVMEEVQRTGDIFFPKNWITNVLGWHRSAEARRVVEAFFEDNPHFPTLLGNKIKQAADALYRNTKE